MHIDKTIKTLLDSNNVPTQNKNKDIKYIKPLLYGNSIANVGMGIYAFYLYIKYKKLRNNMI